MQYERCIVYDWKRNIFHILMCFIISHPIVYLIYSKLKIIEVYKPHAQSVRWVRLSTNHSAVILNCKIFLIYTFMQPPHTLTQKN